MILKWEVMDEEIGGLSFDCGELGIVMSESYFYGCYLFVLEDVFGGVKMFIVKVVDVGVVML